ncbi:Mariner Mos1 transposase [Eumeta japonica]|uniref:Mariner Mos1 transposase n=1 Tax=Eumeta variegata TaxID=151549 RepID=A0A4C1WPQ4_EUMVA|nr:Mariner Mos1 transposase [Eumeta japonica]
MNGQYYANLLAQAREAVVQKRREVIARSAVFDNASVHTARVSRQALMDTGFLEIDHPHYSPDLALSDYFLFSNLKKELRGRRFVDDNQMKMAVESHFVKKKEYFLGGLKALYTRCLTYSSNKGLLAVYGILAAYPAGVTSVLRRPAYSALNEFDATATTAGADTIVAAFILIWSLIWNYEISTCFLTAGHLQTFAAFTYLAASFRRYRK